MIVLEISFFKGKKMSFEVFYWQLNSTDVLNKYVQLDGTFVGVNNVALDLIGGTAQMVNASLPADGDFYTTGGDTRISWAGTALDGIMASGDQLRVIFDRS
jgi:hypothetical protein